MKTRTPSVSEQILNVLGESTRPLTELELQKQISGRKSSKVSALRCLLADRKVLRQGSGKRGDPYQYTLFLAKVDPIDSVEYEEISL